MLKPKMLEALNKQVNAEFFAAYLYLSMSAYFESQNFKGMANWMQVQAQEELQHAMKIYGFIHDCGGRVVLSEVGTPKTAWDTPLAVFEEAYKHECKVTGMINGLVEVAISEKDHAANAFLQWFITEQVEEEASTLEIVEKLKLIGDRGSALFMMDKELGKRGAEA